MRRTFLSILYLNAIILLGINFASCKSEEIEGSYIQLAEKSYTFPIKGETRTIDVSTNIQNITAYSPNQEDWATFSYEKGKLTVTTKDNNTNSERRMTIWLKGAGTTTLFDITQYSWQSSVNHLAKDIKLKVKDGSASSQQSDDSGIKESYDGDINTMYHSKWDKSDLPITLTYNFEGINTMDYILYNPRPTGTNGNFQEFDLYIATESSKEYKKYGSYNFNGSSAVSIIKFESPIEKPTSIKFVVNSGTEGYVSCAEMEFYQKNPVDFNELSIFTDKTCSELKPGLDRKAIDEIKVELYRNIAIDLFENRIDRKDFRVQEYKSWIHPDIQAKINKTAPYSLRDNPTGIVAIGKESLILLADNIGNKNVTLSLVDAQDVTNMGGKSYFLKDGLNVITPDNDGLIYIMYHTRTGTEQPVKINFVTGKVNGYFDSQKHKKEDWKSLLSQATYGIFDLVGKYAHMTFQTEAFRQYTPDGMGLINKYDDIVRLEQEFMGVLGTDKQFKNRMYLAVSNSGYMYASSYHTGYNVSTQSRILNKDQDPSDFDSWWGPAHEIGHVNQTRPGLKWIGMGEVTNNIFSQMIVESFGLETRLSRRNFYASARQKFFVNKEPHNLRNIGDDVMDKLVPFWQLKLYMHNVLGKNDFYPKVFEKVRINPNPATSAKCQIEFVKICCDVAQLDLTSFFENSGFLTPIDTEIDDYGKEQFTITQSEIDACKQYITSKNYPKPQHDFSLITDKTVNNFK